MKIQVWNKFHDRDAVISVKDCYDVTSLDPLSALDYEVYQGGDDAPYARRKLAEIKRKVCGANDCQCATLYMGVVI